LNQTPYDLRLWDGRAYKRSAGKEQVGAPPAARALLDERRGSSPEVAPKKLRSFVFALQK
jgi:hypothetical protein